MSASVAGCSVLTLPAGALVVLRACSTSSPLMASAGSTLRSVTGSIATPLGSAKRSTMPKGAAANLASGGMAPVDTLSGKLSALRRLRPEASLKPLGSSSVNAVCSGKMPLKVTLLTTWSSSMAASPSPSAVGLNVSLLDFKRISVSSLAGTGALKARRMGRTAKQALCAFSRSQLKLAAKGSRTW